MTDVQEWADIIARAFEALPDTDYYTLLSVARDADLETVRAAYYRRARQLHPDVVRGFDAKVREQAAVIFKRVTEAYETLKDPRLRQAYDALLDKGTMRLVVGSRLSIKPKGELDFLKTPLGKQYYLAAKQALAAGDPRNALMSAQLALRYEGTTNAMIELLREIEEKS